MSYFPVILEVRLGDLETLVVTRAPGILRKALNESLRIMRGIERRFDQKIGECISRAVREIAEGQQALLVAGCCSNGIVILVALRVDELRAKL